MYTLKKIWYPIPCKNISEGKAKKVQVTEQPKGVISMWDQEEKLYTS